MEEMETALTHGAEGYEKLKYSFHPVGQVTPTHILFEDEGMARIISYAYPFNNTRPLSNPTIGVQPPLDSH
jgi:hypothetical protein